MGAEAWFAASGAGRGAHGPGPRIRIGDVRDLDAVVGLLDGRLVRDYEAAGFTRTEPFEVRGWLGQLLERRA